ncbi:prohibitin family protein [Sphingobacterium lactis]|uniref:Regulator of protease activity HflC, stomatin/prohibitin superfamily n=1 Tax=Sphingobacterium lactis TaxID=797291 RepID=A0A1H6AKI0_9SPHI|nr:prohibitin family protein [Sphingobacterium lactis]SEG49243.1 Regulator of protease activity HflC, stomatin/prohibitin superfamily [Sphingobacterium lactis]
MKRNLIALSATLIVAFIVWVSCTERIDAGYEGIKVKLYGSEKGVQDVSLVTGRVWYNPVTESIYEFPTYVQTVNYESFTVNAKDGSVFSVDPTLSLRVSLGSSPKIFTKYRKPVEEILNMTLVNHIKDVYRIEFNNYSTDSIISNRERFEAGVQDKMNKFLAQEGFVLEQLTSGIQYPESITQAINAKNAAIQKAQQAENELKVVEADAKKMIVQAEAEAKANELRQQTLSPLIIQQQFIEKWDGSTPLYGNSPVIFKDIK